MLGEERPALVLFPLPVGQCETVAEAFQPGPAPADGGDCEDSEGTDGRREDAEELTVLVPDGSWDCARALVRDLERRRKTLRPGSALRFVRLGDEVVAAHTSSIIEALRSGAGSGRLSTLEAMALLVLEAEACASPEPTTATMDAAAADASSAGGLGVALSGLALLVEHVTRQGEADAEPQRFRSIVKVPPALVEEFETAAKEANAGDGRTHPVGLSRCCVCGALLATPLRMAAHLEGKRHARAAARRYLAACRESGEQPTAGGGAERRAALFGEHSTGVLGGGVAEPPDVALARLHEAVGC